MYQVLSILVIVTIGLFTNILAESRDDCVEDRTAFFLGPYTTTVKQATVDVCDNVIISSKNTNSFEVEYDTFVPDQKGNLIIPQFYTYRGLFKMLVNLDELNIDCFKQKCAGVATAGLRDAANSGPYLKYLKESRGIKVIKILPVKESELRYLSVFSSPKLNIQNRNEMVLIDVQRNYLAISTNLNSKVMVNLVEYDMGQMRLDILTDIKLGKTNKVHPLNEDEINEVYEMARRKFKSKTNIYSPEMLDLLKKMKNVYITGDDIIRGIVPFTKSDGKILDRVQILNAVNDLCNNYSGEYINIPGRKAIYKIDDLLIALLYTYALLDVVKSEEVNLIDFTDETTGVLTFPDIWE